MRAALVGLVAMGCASHIHSEVVGQGATSARARTSADAGTDPASIRLEPGAYQVELAFALPRAQLVDYSVTCPGVDKRGTLGESFEAYRARRIAELRAAPAVRASVGPIEARLVADIELPPNDVGAQRVVGRVHVATTAPGACAIAAVADDAIAGEFRVTRIRDLDAEARLRIMTANTAALHVRTAIANQLVGFGAVIHVRGRCEGTAVDPEREAAWHEIDVVARTRRALRTQLVALGAVERPPMPAPIAEEHVAPPAPNAAWTAGRWTWTGAKWMWIGGGWNVRGVVIRPARARDHRR